MRCCDRRTFFVGLTAMAAPFGLSAANSLQAGTPLSQAEAATGREATAGDMVFRWRHDGAVLRGQLTAPTHGWLAVGFNDAEQLKGTCFVMAQVSDAPPRLELRRAAVPDHGPVADRQVQQDLVLVSGSFGGGASRLNFELAHRSGDALGVNLRAGAATYLMLAWSRSTDFGHHSAFREHQRVIL